MLSNMKHLGKAEKIPISEFCTLLRNQLHDSLEQLLLFGSKARGDDNSESDIDILVLVRLALPK